MYTSTPVPGSAPDAGVLGPQMIEADLGRRLEALLWSEVVLPRGGAEGEWRARQPGGSGGGRRAHAG